jgi:hypothetical protein
MKSLFIKSVFILTAFVCSYSTYAQSKRAIERVLEKTNKISLGSYVALDTIRSYEKTMDDHGKKTYKVHKVFPSRNKKYFIYAEDEFISDGYFQKSKKSKLTFYDKEMHPLWEKEFPNKRLEKCYLDDEGKSVTLRFNSYDSIMQDHEHLLFLDNNGNQIFSELKDASWLLTLPLDFYIVYSTSENSTKSQEITDVTFFDLSNKRKWSKSFSNPLQGLITSSSNDYIRCMVDSVQYVYNRKGDVVYSEKTSKLGGFIIDVSKKGDMFLITSIPKDGELPFWFLQDKFSGDRTILSNYESDSIQLKMYNGGCFVQNAKNIVALAAMIGQNTAEIFMYNFKGKMLGHKTLENVSSVFYKMYAFLNEDGSIQIYDSMEDFGSHQFNHIKSQTQK